MSSFYGKLVYDVSLLNDTSVGRRLVGGESFVVLLDISNMSEVEQDFAFVNAMPVNASQLDWTAVWRGLWLGWMRLVLLLIWLGLCSR